MRQRLIALRYVGWWADVVVGCERAGYCRDSRPAVIYGSKVGPVGFRCLGMLNLGGHRRRVLLVDGRDFSGVGTIVDATTAAVVADAGVVDIGVVDHGAVVDVADLIDIDAIDVAVVDEVSAVPITALIAEADIAEAVVDAAVVADMRSPVTAIEGVAAAVVSPVAGSPQSALVGSLHPCAGNPVVTG